MTETQWRMKCYYCKKYEKGVCPYKNKKQAPKRCRKFEPPEALPRMRFGLAFWLPVIISLISIIISILK